MMVTKSVTKLTLVMMGLLSLIVLNVQANNFAPTSFYLSSPPISLPYSSKVDEAKTTKQSCLTGVVKSCESRKKTWPLNDLGYQLCVSEGFGTCLMHGMHQEHSMFKDCVMINCKRNSVYRSLARVSCLLDCYEESISM
jgi:hypothetical protein